MFGFGSRRARRLSPPPVTAVGDPASPVLPARCESLEPRTLFADSGGFEGYCLGAELRFGDNGSEDPGAVSGMLVKNASGEVDGQIASWDDNLNDGLDTGWVPVHFDARVAGLDYTMLSLGEFGTVSPLVDSCTNIGAVEIRAGVLDVGLSSEWRDVFVRFYRDNQLLGSQLVGGVGVDLMDAQWGEMTESVWVVPPAPDCDRIVITGSIRFRAVEGYVPGQYDLFADILIHERPDPVY